MSNVVSFETDNIRLEILRMVFRNVYYNLNDHSVLIMR